MISNINIYNINIFELEKIITIKTDILLHVQNVYYHSHLS